MKLAAEVGTFHRLLRPKAALLPSRPKAVLGGWVGRGGVGFEYTKTVGQIHKHIWTNTQKHLDTYTNTFGHIHKHIWTNTQKQVDKYTTTYKSVSVIRDYGLILWKIEAMHYILLLGMPKPFLNRFI